TAPPWASAAARSADAPVLPLLAPPPPQAVRDRHRLPTARAARDRTSRGPTGPNRDMASSVERGRGDRDVPSDSSGDERPTGGVLVPSTTSSRSAKPWFSRQSSSSSAAVRSSTVASCHSVRLVRVPPGSVSAAGSVSPTAVFCPPVLVGAARAAWIAERLVI